MLVDLDHLLAVPIFQVDRCSIGFHPLHSYWAMIGFFLLLLLRHPFRVLGIGLLLHMATDLIDCMIMYDECPSCYAAAPAGTLLEAISNFLGL